MVTDWLVLFQRSPPSAVSDLFSDLRDGARLLDLLEVMSGQPMVSDVATGQQWSRQASLKLKYFCAPSRCQRIDALFPWQKRERGHGVFQQRGDIESALNFLKRKSVSASVGREKCFT